MHILGVKKKSGFMTILLHNMRAEVEKSDGEVYSELEICRASKIGHGNQSVKAMKLARTKFKWQFKPSL